jgi:glycosyltransferase involved in cell wall biosynthesis
MLNGEIIVLVPTYNNAGTLRDVLLRILAMDWPLLVVNDGSTDETAGILASLTQTWGPRLLVIHHARNQGKGAALKSGFREALRRGFRYALTLDADGQHFPEDIPLLVEAAGENTLVVGSRPVQGADGGSSFANRFSNFWFRLYTACDLPDTQTGFRLYPLQQLPSLSLMSSRYEAELSLLVFSAWKGLTLKPVSVRVAYPEDRVSHFRPALDFLRISALNTLLLLLALVYGWPRIWLRRLLFREKL